jgi:unsaturated rhamnogalacturonyl hydrolase
MNDTAKKVMGAMLAIQRYPWEQGVCAQAMYEAGQTEIWVAMAHDAILRQKEDGRLAVINDNIAVTDPAANGEVCLRAWELTGDTFYRDGARRMMDYLMKDAPRTPDGIIYHNTISFAEGYSPDQLWIDAAYMAPPFIAVMGEVEEAAKQLEGYFRYLQDKETKVLFHNYDVGTGRFVRRLRWATGNGWALMGVARVAVEAKKRGKLALYEELTAMGNELLDAVLRYQLPDGRFRDILDDPDSFVDGTSSMMLSVYVYRGVLEGWLDKKYLDCAERAYAAVSQHVDRFGIIHQVCGCPHFVSQGTSAEAQASFIMADAWREKVLG